MPIPADRTGLKGTEQGGHLLTAGVGTGSGAGGVAGGHTQPGVAHDVGADAEHEGGHPGTKGEVSADDEAGVGNIGVHYEIDNKAEREQGTEAQ